MLRLLAAATLPCYALADGGTNFYVAAGRDFSFVVDNGIARGTGRNHLGQLGTGDRQNVDDFKDGEVQFPAGTFDVDRLPAWNHNPTEIMVTQVSAGNAHTLFLLNTGEVFGTGSSHYGQLGLGPMSPPALRTMATKIPLSKIKAVAAGYAHSVFLNEGGKVYTAGSNKVGQIGQGVGVKEMYWPHHIRSKHKAVGIAAGYDFTYILTEEGKVFATGQNLGGQLGTGDKKTQFIFKEVFKDSKIREVQAGESHGFFIAEDNQVYGTGANFDGQLGNSGTQASAVPVKLGYKADVLSAGGDSTCLGDLQLRCFGSNRDGQLGLTPEVVMTPTAVSAEDGSMIEYADSIAVADTHSLFLNHKDVYVTGKNTYGQLGSSTLNDITKPYLLVKLDRLDRTTTEAPPTPAPPTPAPTPPTDTTAGPTRQPGSDEDTARRWPLLPLGTGLATGLGLVILVSCFFGGDDAPTPTVQTPMEITASVELAANAAGRSMHDQTV